MVEIVSSFVSHFHHPCVTIITSQGMIKVEDVKELFSKERVQVVYTSSHTYHLETIQTWSECGHFLWFEKDGPSPGPLLQELWGSGESGGTYYWLGDLLEDQIKTVNIKFNVKLYILKHKKDLFEIVEVYDVEAGGVRVSNLVGTWRLGSLGPNIWEENIWERRRELQGKNMRTLTLSKCPHVCLDKGNSMSAWYGILPDIYNSLAKDLNFTYTLARPTDGKWGMQDKVSCSPSTHN